MQAVQHRRSDLYPDIGGRKFTVEIEEFEYELLDNVRTALQEIKSVQYPLNDTFLLRFLRTKDHNVEATVKLMQKYINLLEKNADLYNIPFQRLQEFYEAQIAVVLKNRDQQGSHIVWFRIDKWEPKQFSFDEMIFAMFMLYEEMSTAAETQKNGFILIWDATLLTLSHARKIAEVCCFKQMRTIFSVHQGVFPAKVKGVFGVNFPYVLTSLFAVTKYFLKAKIRSRFHIHSYGLDVLHSHINHNVLPDILGGSLTLEDVEDTQIGKSVITNENYYRALRKSLLPGFVPKSNKCF